MCLRSRDIPGLAAMLWMPRPTCPIATTPTIAPVGGNAPKNSQYFPNPPNTSQKAAINRTARVCGVQRITI